MTFMPRLLGQQPRKPLRLSLRQALCFFVTILIVGSSLAAQHERHDARALAADPRMAPGQIAPILSGLGHHRHPVTANSPRVQLFFDQGLRLTYAFNHSEALRAFKEAARLDPSCAMAYWGWALVLGPNLNLPMQDEVVEQAHEAIKKALDHIGQASEKEADMIRALAVRYSKNPKTDRAQLDRAYAQEMESLWQIYRDDPDVGTLYAAALMNLSPWDYWYRDGRPKETTSKALEVLEEVLGDQPDHIGALHYYIHLVEAAHPEWGTAAADALRGLAPGAGHLVHMPSHIYMQVGRYVDAFDVNRMATLADQSYITQCRAQGIYPLDYYPHNIHFLVWSGMMLGRTQETLAEARKVAAGVPSDFHENHWALYETFLAMPLYTMVRFGMWDEVLAESAPDPGRKFLTGIDHYAKGLALTAKKRLDEAQAKLDALVALMQDKALGEVRVGSSPARPVLEIAQEILAGELAGARGDHDKAISHLERAVRLQDGLNYTEPPDWYYPVRHSLGAALLDAGKAAEAETVYWQDLKQYPGNPYSLFGLWQSFKAQGKNEQAASALQLCRNSWAQADRQLTSSRF